LAAVQKISNPFDFDHWQAIPRATNQIIFSAWQPMLKLKNCSDWQRFRKSAILLILTAGKRNQAAWRMNW
jgi:hypothetical protein